MPNSEDLVDDKASLSVGTGLFLGATVLAIDQLTKWYMIDLLTLPSRTISVAPFLNFRLGLNSGVSFGFFGDLGSFGPAILSAIGLVIIGLLAYWFWRSDGAWDRAALSIIIGGALGNILDRLRSGAVTDFLDFFVGNLHWPAFNFADTAIVTGAAILVFRSLVVELFNSRG